VTQLARRTERRTGRASDSERCGPERVGSLARDARGDGVADLARRAGYSTRRGARPGRRHGLLHPARGLVQAQVLEQHRDREHGRRRVGLALPGDVRAEPCTGSNMLGAVRSGLMLPLAASPMPP
jgi:hypothetical protein